MDSNKQERVASALPRHAVYPQPSTAVTRLVYYLLRNTHFVRPFHVIALVEFACARI